MVQEGCNKKAANVVPLFNSGGQEEPINYRPVHVISVRDKLLESFLNDTLNLHLERHRLIRVCWHGFTKESSCLANLIEIFEETMKKVNEGKFI